MEGHPHHRRVGRRFGFAVVGLGEGKALVKGLEGHPDLHVVCVCDTDPALLAATAQRFAVPHPTPDVAEAVAREDVDVVAIYTPDALHLEHIRLALEAGKHVICTKPLVTRLEEARAVIDLLRERPTQRLMVGQSSRFFGSMQHQRHAYESGALGRLSFVEASYVHDMRWFYEDRAWARASDFDLLRACCSHPVDLVRWYLGDVAEVHAYASRSATGERAGFQGPDTFVVNLVAGDGRVARVLGLFGLEQPHASRPWIEVGLYGDGGTFIASYPQLEAIVKRVGESERIERYFEETYHYFQFEGVNHHAGEFLDYAQHFAEHLVRGTVAQPDAVDGFATMATLEAIDASIHSGRPQPVERLEGSQR
jgi:predicted dehydrogenase